MYNLFIFVGYSGYIFDVMIMLCLGGIVDMFGF